MIESRGKQSNLKIRFGCPRVVSACCEDLVRPFASELIPSTVKCSKTLRWIVVVEPSQSVLEIISSLSSNGPDAHRLSTSVDVLL